MQDVSRVMDIVLVNTPAFLSIAEQMVSVFNRSLVAYLTYHNIISWGKVDQEVNHPT